MVVLYQECGDILTIKNRTDMNTKRRLFLWRNHIDAKFLFNDHAVNFRSQCANRHLRPESRPVLEKLAYEKGPEGKAARTALQKYQTF